MEIEIPQHVQAHADRMHDEIKARAGRELVALQVQLERVMSVNLPRRMKYISIVAAADQAAAAVAPNTPCSKGCSDCCYQAVPIGTDEARLLAAASGRKLNMDAARPLNAATIMHMQENTERLLQNPTPCPFLKDNACSVYADRPVTCRTHHVLHSDSSRCSLFRARDGGVPVPLVKFDIRWVEEALAGLIMTGAGAADIREFFPNG